ncbi:MAG: hypothetical protein LBV18_01805 [Alistipes sp.]|nr:hypothetical protein [Alistipes sp.]
MKRSILLALAAIVFTAVGVSAQTPEEWQASDARIAEMQELSELPKATKLASIDGLATELHDTAMGTIKITESLKSLMQAPDLALALELSEGIKAEATALSDAVQKVEAVLDEVKGIRNPLQIASATKSVNYSQKAIRLVGEENVFHAKVIVGIIDSLQGE